MGAFSLSRRSFLKGAAAIGVAGATASSVSIARTALADVGDAAAAGETKRIRSGCRACGKMECGVWVTVSDGKVIRIEGDNSAFQSHGNCCSKSQSSVQAAYHPDRLKYPLKRTNPKGEDPGWERISWDEAIKTMAEKFQSVIDQ